MTEITNTAFDISIFFGGLMSKTVTWEAIHTASGLASAIARLQILLDANTRLTGVLVDTAPKVMDNTLRMIANSDVQPAVGFLM